MKLIDTHTHLYEESFAEDLDFVIKMANENGIYKMYIPNVDETTIKPLISLCEKYDCCIPMMGLHPTSIDENFKKSLSIIKDTLFKTPEKFCAVGEIGIDLYWDKTYLKEQQKVLEEQIQWALEWNLPLVIHCREAFPELFEVMRPYQKEPLTGIFHSFTGTRDEVMEVLDYPGFMIGINGVVTFKKSTLPQVLADVSLERVVLETDSPYLAPVPYRGKRNESSYIGKVAEKLASIYGIGLAEVDSITTQNALKVFKSVE